MVDLDSIIIFFLTNIHGKRHDGLVGTYNRFFKQILGRKFAIADTAFNGNSNIVAGLKKVSTEGEVIFDRISRSEQVVVEHVNDFVKNSVALDKNTKFRHSPDKLIYSVFIMSGIYNWKRFE